MREVTTRMVRNILAVFNSADNEEWNQGYSWYRRANEHARELAGRYGVSVDTAAGVIAALSPNNPWLRNLADAETVLRLASAGKRWESGRYSTYKKNARKAYRIACGEDPDTVLGGPKVRAFYRLIRDPENASDVCVDGHAANIARGVHAGVQSAGNLDRAGRYQAIAHEYKVAARSVQLLPCQLQAITWLTWRRMHYTAAERTEQYLNA